jgi:hypothetical protein
MLTQTLPLPSVSNPQVSDQIETQISDAEILQRVLNIRSGWTLAERIARRREAERRFAALVNQLGDL